MNLIEQLGGYDKAKKELNSPSNTNVFFQCEIEQALLGYRRQHNIFEVGDKVVIRKADSHPDLFTYESISKSGNMHFFESPFNYGHLDLCKVRHATDEEIAAGKRLEVKSEN
ncbi:hypothetical protein [Acinetobacter sp. YH12066]|uniref:hypothetical protein n=1 Tax=Acinetobacter sp. YH12066 TaxID=2601063 RepID=UPI0015D18971|nr:hypothetical protein [Acinetobacter sp. YH12066]